MRELVSNLPKHAVYDYTDDFGYKHYHTARRRYEVVTTKFYGKTRTQVYSIREE